MSKSVNIQDIIKFGSGKDLSQNKFRAVWEFKNNITLSIIAGEHFYSNPKVLLDKMEDYISYEIAILKYDTFITKEVIPHCDSDVLGWQSKQDINQIIKLIQDIK